MSAPSAMPPGRPCDWCSTDEETHSVRDWNTHEVRVSICDECVLGGVWVEEVDGAAKTVLLAYAGDLARTRLADQARRL